MGNTSTLGSTSTGVSASFSLIAGPQQVRLAVTSESGELTTVYTLHLTRVKPSNDARLSSLTVQYALDPAANPPYRSFYDNMRTLELWPVRPMLPWFACCSHVVLALASAECRFGWHLTLISFLFFQVVDSEAKRIHAFSPGFDTDVYHYTLKGVMDYSYLYDRPYEGLVVDEFS